ncbi:uncharacterized protein LOC129583248 [Paramacrobiotus metropolitanus]|uniref:uncharacterized protein LOC129583248 n=1 Tax=Paramacrobiotus metropolitanus TaxID=2943436 RepID=UPI002446166E|nr:uncharacterized protein LOC129583248 [Paramacrobiotus metropolitanus]XP_055330948.1 uncharacterized protein LOC129583248 [Paramacrobiotus metropolitanus]
MSAGTQASVTEDALAVPEPPVVTNNIIEAGVTASTSTEDSASKTPETSGVHSSASTSASNRMHLRRNKRKRDLSLTVKDEKEVKQELGENDFIVERVLGYKQVNKIRYARIKWRGFSQTSWEPYDSIFYVNANEVDRGTAKEKEEKEHKRLKAESEKRRLERKRRANKILDKRERSGKIDYKVRWKGFPRVVDSWITEEKLNRPDLVAKFSASEVATKPEPDDVLVAAAEAPKSAAPLPAALWPPALLDTRTPKLNDMLAAKSKTAAKSVTFVPPEPEPLSDQALAIPPPLPIPSTSRLIKPVFTVRRRKPKTVKVKKPPAPPKIQPIYNPLKTSPDQLLGWRGPADCWSVADVCECLRQYGFGDIVHKFQERRVDGPAFLALNEPQTVQQKMQIPLGPSLKISKLVKDLHEVLKK